jgi:parvulin-like peptidyl-prolyl isomerase
MAGSLADVERVFGAAFARAVAAAPVGEWSGPVRSPYGAHLVFVRARTDRRVPALAAVRGRALNAFLRERGAARTDEAMAALRARYDVTVADDAGGR